MLAFLLAACAHAVLFLVMQLGLMQGPELAVIAGDPTLEVSLVAAAPAVEEIVTEPIPEPAITPPPEALPIPEPPPVPPPEAMLEPVPAPIEPAPIISPKRQPPKPRPVAERKPAPRRAPVTKELAGDGSSATPGTDAAIMRAAAGADRPKASYLRKPSPLYTAEDIRAGRQGVVELRLRVGASGRVTSATLLRSCGFPLLDERAISTVRNRWTFRPAQVAGVPIESEVIVPISFSRRD